AQRWSWLPLRGGMVHGAGGDGRAAVPSPGPGPPVASAVTTTELLDAARGVHDLRPTRVERVRGRGDVHVDHRVAGAVLPGRGVFRGPGGTGQVRRVRTLVPEDHGTVPRMDSLLHDVLLPIGSRPLDGEA